MFTYYTKETAPEASRRGIDHSVATFGFLPKLHQVLAEAPATYEAYHFLFDIFQKDTTLTPLEQQVVFMTANYENRCHYCTAGHSMIMQMMKLPAEHIEALREGRRLSDPKLEALRTFTRLLIEKRGHVGDQQLQAFLAAGYDNRQALEVLCGLAAKLISNFTNGLAHTELDEPVKPFAWAPPVERVLKAS
jgi:alkylhydroperoxidase family enzyme